MFNALLVGLVLANPFAAIQQTDALKKIDEVQEIPTTVTKHSITLPSGKLDYTATAAQLPLTNNNGDVECRMFYVAYTKDGADAHHRPVTFAFNGGPGSATLWLHMGALGPKRAPMNDDGSLPAPPYQAMDNMDTWLDFTDVVVIDAPACGWSRVTKPEFNSKYFGVQPDIAAFTEFIRGWLTKHDRWNSPLFVAGESYGGIRGSGLSNSLWGNGIALSGFISISGTSNAMTLDGMRGNDITFVSFVPSMAACAFYHHKSDPKFKNVEQVVDEVTKWTDKVYGPALLRGDSLTGPERDEVAAKLASYLGLTKKYVLGSHLRVSEFSFFKELLRDDGLSIGRYDGRLIAKEETTIGDQQAADPSNDAVSAPFYTTVNAYLRGDLGVKTDVKYRMWGELAGWPSGDGAYAETASDLRRVLAANKHFHVLYCCGYYDLACPFNGTKFTVNHMGLDPESLSHVHYAYYPAGHMMYIEKNSRKKLHDDVAKFEADAAASR